jgi:hypothetical protein
VSDEVDQLEFETDPQVNEELQYDNFGNVIDPDDRPVGTRNADELREALADLSDDLDYYVGVELTRDQVNAAAQLVRLAKGHL